MGCFPTQPFVGTVDPGRLELFDSSFSVLYNLVTVSCSRISVPAHKPMIQVCWLEEWGLRL